MENANQVQNLSPEALKKILEDELANRKALIEKHKKVIEDLEASMPSLEESIGKL